MDMKTLDSSILPFVKEPVDLPRNLEIVLEWMIPKTYLHPPSNEILAAIANITESPQRDEMFDYLIDSYINAMNTHFTMYANPILASVISLSQEQHNNLSVQRITDIIKDSRRHYIYPFKYIVLNDYYSSQILDAFKSLVILALPLRHIFRLLRVYLKKHSVTQPSDDLINRLSLLYSMYGSKIEEVVMEAYLNEIESILVEKYHSVWDHQVKDEIDAWATTTLLQTAKKLFSDIPTSDNIKLIVRDMLMNIRTEELFDIIVYFPESTPAIYDMKAFMRNSSQRAKIVSSLQQSASKRLLHGGANTVDVLSGYISIIKCFSILEPRGVLLDKIARPIRRYLKERNDTVKEVLSGILGDSTSAINYLSEELIHSASNYGKVFNQAGEDDLEWNPDPLDAPPDFKSDNKIFDVISNLISIFDNKELIVKHLVKRFADTMLLSSDFDEEKMLVTIELLKLKFGEDVLRNLDIMTKDISESKRIDSLIHAKGSESTDEHFHVDVISDLYWPKHNSVPCEPPSVIKKQMEKYFTFFQDCKQGRSLHWVGNLGSVTIEIETDGKTREFIVSPEKASLIYLFQEKEQYSIDELVEMMKMDKAHVKSALIFWQKQGLIVKNNDDSSIYQLQENSSKMPGEYDDLKDSNVVNEDPKEEMRVYWSYVVGMLTNLGTVPVEKIHSFLKLLVPAETPYTKTIDDLKQFLDLMVDEEKLINVGEAYKLAK